jgi:hypothetical protein
MPSVCGVPRLRKSASTFFSSISTLALALASLRFELVVHLHQLDLLAD